MAFLKRLQVTWSRKWFATSSFCKGEKSAGTQAGRQAGKQAGSLENKNHGAL
jgi:hypothetical protein